VKLNEPHKQFLARVAGRVSNARKKREARQIMAEDTVAGMAEAIKHWVVRNSADYPGVAATIRGPATQQELTACERAIGTRLPEELRQLLLVFNGQEYDEAADEFPCAPWSRFLGVDEIADVWNALPDIVSMCEEEMNESSVDGYRVTADHRLGKAGAPILAYNEAWVPFATADNGEGGPPVIWLLDQAPAAGAPSGRVIGFGGEGDGLSIWAPSLHVLLEDVLRVMRRRNPDEGKDKEEEQGQGGRHRKVLWDDGPRVWHQYIEEED
jgi:cell wall assembly regulator SMI1